MTAPLVLDEPMDGVPSFALVQTLLRPTLQSGDIVIDDNLGSYKSNGVNQATGATRATCLHLPP